MPELPEEPTTTRLGGASLTFVTAGQGASDADVPGSDRDDAGPQMAVVAHTAPPFMR